jgi:hypothetical protein
MNPLVLKDPGLHLMLLAIDEELAADTRALGCRQCGEKRKECVTASARAIRTDTHRKSAASCAQFAVGAHKAGI